MLDFVGEFWDALDEDFLILQFNNSNLLHYTTLVLKAQIVIDFTILDMLLIQHKICENINLDMLYVTTKISMQIWSSLLTFFLKEYENIILQKSPIFLIHEGWHLHGYIFDFAFWGREFRICSWLISHQGFLFDILSAPQKHVKQFTHCCTLVYSIHIMCPM